MEDLKMKYTRYDIRKRNNITAGFIIIIIMILVLAYIIGLAVSNLFLKNGKFPAFNHEALKNKNNEETISKKDDSSSSQTVFTAVQGGKFAQKSNADGEIEILKPFGNPFIIEEEGKYKVILGIFSADKVQSVCKMLSDNNIENSKMNFIIKQSDLCDKEILEILNGYTEVLTALSGKNVKAVQTEEFKKWCSSLKNADDKSKNIQILNELKNKVKDMPKELQKQNAPGYYIYIYNILKKISC